MAKARRLFLVPTPLGNRVLLTRDRWREEIVRFKHPAMAGHESDIRACLTEPHVVRVGEKDPEVHLYYRAVGEGHVCTVVGAEAAGTRFVIAAYFTRHPKRGSELWTR